MSMNLLKPDLNNFFESLESMVEAKVNLLEALDILSKNKNKSIAKLAKKLASNMRTGKTMSSGLKKYLASEEYAILAAEEKAGNIIEGIKRYKKLKQIKSKAKGSFISAFGYPTFVIAFMIGVIYIFGLKLFNQLIGVVGKVKFKQTPLYLYYEMSKPQVILLITLIIVCIFGGLFLFTFKAIGNYRIKTDRIAPFRLYRYFQGVVFLFMLSSLMKSGYSIVQAIDEIMKTSQYFNVMLKPIKQRIMASDNIGTAMLRTRIYLPNEQTARLLSVIARFSGVENKMEIIAKRHAENMLKQIDLAGKILQVVALMITGLIVGGLVVGTVQSLASLSQMISY